MAERNFFARLFGLEDANSTTDLEEENRAENNAETHSTESDGTTLQDAVNFVAELQSYYYNDICKMQTDLVVQTSMTQSEVSFVNKKIKQDVTDWVDVETFSKMGDYVKKGIKVCVNGSLITSVYEKKDGTKAKRVYVLAKTIELMQQRKD